MSEMTQQTVTHRINTTKTLSNESYWNGGQDSLSRDCRNIAVSPLVSDRYDEAVTEDPVLLQERKDTDQKLYEIFQHAPFRDMYTDSQGLIKIPKEDVSKVFHYTREKLAKMKTLTAFETVIAINEFYDFNYDFVCKRVLSPKMMAEILEDYYHNMGMADRIDQASGEPLF